MTLQEQVTYLTQALLILEKRVIALEKSRTVLDPNGIEFLKATLEALQAEKDPHVETWQIGTCNSLEGWKPVILIRTEYNAGVTYYGFYHTQIIDGMLHAFGTMHRQHQDWVHPLGFRAQVNMKDAIRNEQ